MNFQYQQGERVDGHLAYVEQDRAVDFDPDDKSYAPSSHVPTAALVVGKTLQIEFRVDDGRLLYAWGYLPKESWQRASAPTHLGTVTRGRVFVRQLDNAITPGAGYPTDLQDVPVLYHEATSLLTFGNLQEADKLVEIATGTVIGLKGNQLCCVVLKPVMR